MAFPRRKLNHAKHVRTSRSEWLLRKWTRKMFGNGISGLILRSLGDNLARWIVSKRGSDMSGITNSLKGGKRNAKGGVEVSRQEVRWNERRAPFINLPEKCVHAQKQPQHNKHVANGTSMRLCSSACRTTSNKSLFSYYPHLQTPVF